MSHILNLNVNVNVCNNCRKPGHSFNQCKLPIVSYGIIVIRFYQDEIQYLMIRRKDSYGYIDFVRGKYVPYNVYQVYQIINQMSNSEKSRLLTDTFEKLWNDMWGNVSKSQQRSEEMYSLKKFEIIKNGVNDEYNNLIELKDIVKSSLTNWEETEWEFPKGRRNTNEKDLDCAMREFEEETGIPKGDICIIENILPFEETFIGTNHKSNKHKYFLGVLEKTVGSFENYQTSEVSKLEWKSFENCIESIRPYNLEKRKLITSINKILKEYRLYS
jgi:8-oxo-dGTP pyrophosphatase MutT (NUDIX family)